MAVGRAALTAAIEQAWQSLVGVRDELKDQGMGIAAARLGRLCTELDDLRAVLVQRAPSPGELSEALADELARRATMHALAVMPDVERKWSAGDDPRSATTAAIASSFVVGYGACLDDSRSAKAIFRERRRVKAVRK